MRPVLEDWIEAEALAKVNLDLRIFPPREDGYHPLETLFCRIDLADRIRLRLRREPGVTLRVTGPEAAPAGPDNLAVQAAELMLRSTGLPAGVEIELEKRIPAASGLGGGSSDAAAVLRILNARLPPAVTADRSGRHRDATSTDALSSDGLLRLAGELGADVPFFVLDVPCAFGWGIGDRLIQLPDRPSRPLLLLLPELRVSTRDAYALWDRVGSRRSATGTAGGSMGRRWRDRMTWEGWAAECRNDFEPVIFGRHPELARLHRLLLETGPILARLSGSGSALFAVYGSERERERALGYVATQMPEVRRLSAVGPV